MSNESFATLQLGMGWFPEQAGGLTRFYSDLLRHLPPTGVEVRGLVAGSPEVMRESVGRVRAFAPISAPLLSRCWAARPAVAHEIAKGQVALVASHFALYTRPVLDLIRP